MYIWYGMWALFWGQNPTPAGKWFILLKSHCLHSHASKLPTNAFGHLKPDKVRLSFGIHLCQVDTCGGTHFSTKVRLVDREGSGSLGIILRNVAGKEIVMIEQLTGREWLVAGTKSMNLPTRICKYYPIITIMVASCPQIWIAGLKSGFHSQDCRCHSQTLGFSVLGLIDWGVYDWKLLDLHIV